MAQKKLGIVGVGNMGSAILKGVMAAKLFTPGRVVVCDVATQKADAFGREFNVSVASSAAGLAREASIVLLAVKPQSMEQCLSELKNAIEPSHLVISIAAGITTDFIQSHLDAGIRVVRVMPNTPALVGAGASALCRGEHATDEDLAEAERIFGALGKVYRLDESLMDAVTAISGSGPAYLFLFAECLVEAALRCGLAADVSPGLVAQTLFGASKLLIESGEAPSTLRARVTSPGGTTEAAVAVFNARGLREIVVEAVRSALRRAKELGGVKKN